jgi:microcompartment protein CcmL/EutN
MKITGPAIAVLELESIARGYVVADAVIKRAQVTVALAEAVSPGKYVLLFHGGVAEVEEAFGAGEEASGPLLLDRLFLPQASGRLVAALGGQLAPGWAESLGIVEAHSVAATVLAADTALKRAEVELTELRLARGIGGKGYFCLTGTLHMVEAALEGAAQAVDPTLLKSVELIQQPHWELRAALAPRG